MTFKTDIDVEKSQVVAQTWSYSVDPEQTTSSQRNQLVENCNMKENLTLNETKTSDDESDSDNSIAPDQASTYT